MIECITICKINTVKKHKYQNYLEQFGNKVVCGPDKIIGHKNGTNKTIFLIILNYYSYDLCLIGFMCDNNFQCPAYHEKFCNFQEVAG